MAGILGLIQNAFIDTGESLSSALYVANNRPVSVEMPDAWDELGTPAVLTFQGSSDGARFVDLYDGQGNEVTVIAAPSQVVLLPSPSIQAVYIKIRSGTGAAPVPQSAGATLVVTITKLPYV